MKNTQHNNNDLLIFIYKNRKTFFLTGIIAGIISIVVSLFLPVLYQSRAIVYPTATSTVSFNAQSNAKASSMDFGEEENAEQLIQFLQSSKLRNRIIEKFELAKVYKLDPEEKNFHYKLGKKYDKHISFSRTKFGSVEIEVLDEVPERAAEIANKIVDLIDTVKNEVIKKRTIPAYEINKRKIEQLRESQEALNTEMDSLAAMGVVNDKARSSLYEALNQVKSSADREYFMEQIKINQKYGSRYDALSDLREFRTENMTIMETSYEQAKSDAFEDFIHKFVVEEASASDKKAKPKRSIIVIVSTFAALLFAFIVLLIKDRIDEIKTSL